MENFTFCSSVLAGLLIVPGNWVTLLERLKVMCWLAETSSTLAEEAKTPVR